jgi:hypothetical protein
MTGANELIGVRRFFTCEECRHSILRTMSKVLESPSAVKQLRCPSRKPVIRTRLMETGLQYPAVILIWFIAYSASRAAPGAHTTDHNQRFGTRWVDRTFDGRYTLKIRIPGDRHDSRRDCG